MADISIKRKAQKINQKLPTSNIVPKKDACEAFENKAERKTATTTPPPEIRKADLGKTILPSKNRARHQKITHKDRPKTTNNPLEVSIGKLVKGKKKTGNNTMTKKSDKKENLSNILERII